MDRAQFLKGAGVGTAAVSLPAIAGLAGSRTAAGATSGTTFKDEGVGSYTDPSVANQVSNFSINRQLVSCGVGTIATPGTSGPFAMLMYSMIIQSYGVDRASGRIEATGRMRSITRIANQTVEDVEHEFLAIAVDTGADESDRFDVHFTTPFWHPGNPFCTPSTVRPGWCRFGGELLKDDLGKQMGDVAVGP